MVAVLRAMNELTQRLALAGRAGLTFGGARDLYEALGYRRNLSVQDYRDRYERGDIAARVIECYPNDTWAGAPEVIEDPANLDVLTPFEQALADLDARLHIWSVFRRADILAGIGRYSVVLIGGPGPLESPMPRLRSTDDVVFLMPYAEDNASISELDLVTDSEDPRYGEPDYYTIRDIGGRSGLSRKVHYSRCLHVVMDNLDSKLYSQPRLQRVWNRMDDLDKVIGGGSEAYWLRVRGGFQFDIDKDMKVEADEKEAMQRQLDEFEHHLRRIVRTRGVTTTQFEAEVADFTGPKNSIVSLISGATGIPQRMLLGSERGELASTQDAEAWDDRISNRQHQSAEPQIIRPFIDKLVSYGAIPEPDSWFVQWPTSEELTETERVEAADKAAGLNTKAGQVVITADEIRERYLGLEALSDEERAAIDVPVEEDDDEIEVEEEDEEADQDDSEAAGEGDEGGPPQS